MIQAAWNAGKHSATGCEPGPPVDNQFTVARSSEQNR